MEKVKYLFIFIITFLIGILGITGFIFTQKSPAKPITNIIQTVAKPDFSIANSPSESIRGSVKQMSGDVFWQSRVATNSSQINSLIFLQQGEEIQTKDNGNLVLEFPNIINMTVSPKTQIDFVQTLPQEFVISIASGSADIKKLSDTPVSIRSYHLLIRQNTGDLSLNVDIEKGITSLNVISGSVTASYNDLDLTSHVIDFTGGQKANFNDATRSFE